VNRFTDLYLYWDFAWFIPKAAKSPIWQPPCSGSAIFRYTQFQGWQDKISMSHRITRRPPTTTYE
jgi:hypothetical protein